MQDKNTQLNKLLKIIIYKINNYKIYYHIQASIRQLKIKLILNTFEPIRVQTVHGS